MGKRKIERAAEQERYLQALRMRALGVPPEVVAVRLGMKDAHEAEKAISRAIETRRKNKDALAEYLLPLEVEKLDRMEAKISEALEREHYQVSASGKVALDPATGQPLIDDMPIFQAVDRLLKIAERRARLRGLDAPTRSESRTEVWTVEVLNTQLAELQQEIARRTPGVAAETPGTAGREITTGTQPILDADILPDSPAEAAPARPPGTSPGGQERL